MLPTPFYSVHRPRAHRLAATCEEDLQARVDALRAERDALAQELAARAQLEAARQRSWSWWRFLVGLCIAPALTPLVLAVLGSCHGAASRANDFSIGAQQ